MAKKTSTTAVPKNNPGTVKEAKVRGSVPKMKNPPPPKKGK